MKRPLVAELAALLAAHPPVPTYVSAIAYPTLPPGTEQEYVGGRLYPCRRVPGGRVAYLPDGPVAMMWATVRSGSDDDGSIGVMYTTSRSEDVLVRAADQSAVTEADRAACAAYYAQREAFARAVAKARELDAPQQALRESHPVTRWYEALAWEEKIALTHAVAPGEDSPHPAWEAPEFYARALGIEPTYIAVEP